MSVRTHRFATTWGAVMSDSGQARFRIWAPDAPNLALRAGGRDRAMLHSGDGWHELICDDLPAGTHYGFVLPGGRVVPDPVARAQAGDVHGPSVLVDPQAWHWQSPHRPRPWHEAVIYELHIGTFTPEGTFHAAIARLPHLVALGITAIEIMPVAQFPGTRGWGYDGVLPYAPHNAYGPPEVMKAFIDAAQGAGLMVLLDVVYNHFGPEGNYQPLYAAGFFDDTRQTPWGAAIDFTRAPVRQFFIENALYWLGEYRLDGLRLDAIDQIHDDSRPDVLHDLALQARAHFPDREVHLCTEDNRNLTHLHARDTGGRPRLYTAEWNDDAHNAAHVIATGEVDGYYADFADEPAALFARALAQGFAWQGENSPITGTPRGQPSGHLPPVAFIDFLQNHDQIGNRALGERLNALTDAATLRALTAILLLSPHIPLLFMGDECGETRPFPFFVDVSDDLADAVRKGRAREFAGFGGYRGVLPDPSAPATFAAAQLDWGRCASTDGQARLHETRDLLHLRQTRIVPHLAHARGGGRVLACTRRAFAVQWELAGAVLDLRANLGDREQSLPPAHGALLHATGDSPPWAAWYITT